MGTELAPGPLPGNEPASLGGTLKSAISGLKDIPEDMEVSHSVDLQKGTASKSPSNPRKDDLKLPPIPIPDDQSGKSSDAWNSARSNVQEIITTGQRELEDRRQRRLEKKLRLDTGHARKSPKQQMDAHLDSLVALMKTEWPQIAKMATSLKSGTGVVEEALVRKLNGTVKKINLLCLRFNEATDKMIEKARKLSNSEVQMLMKMFDTLNYPLLTDYVRTCLSNSSRLKPLKHENDAAKKAAARNEKLKIAREKTLALTQDSNATDEAMPGPSADNMIVFVKPNVKSDFDRREMDDLWGPAPEHRKGWIGLGLTKKPRDGLGRDAPNEVRHQLLSGWSTGEVYNSSLFIDPVNGHNHTPVYPIYNSDDEDAAKEQMEKIRELPAKLKKSKIEDEERRKVPPAAIRGRYFADATQTPYNRIFGGGDDDDSIVSGA